MAPAPAYEGHLGIQFYLLDITAVPTKFVRLSYSPDRCGYIGGHVLHRVKSAFIFCRCQRPLDGANPLAPLQNAPLHTIEQQ